jgi:hypothetical protein
MFSSTHNWNGLVVCTIGTLAVKVSKQPWRAHFESSHIDP